MKAMTATLLIAVACLLFACWPDPGTRDNPRDPEGTDYSAPTADFTVNGALSASTFEDALLDGAASTDPLERLLMCRWDFEDDDDGVFDTEFSVQSTASYRYREEGVVRVTLEVRNDAALTHAVTKEVTVAHSEAPIADLTYDPQNPSIGEEITFDASASSDDDTEVDELSVRWDFDGDRVFETDWSTTKTAT